MSGGFWSDRFPGAFMQATGADRDDALSDLLADLMHWCDRSGLTFDDELDRAGNHYEAETTTDDDQPTKGD